MQRKLYLSSLTLSYCLATGILSGCHMIQRFKHQAPAAAYTSSNKISHENSFAIFSPPKNIQKMAYKKEIILDTPIPNKNSLQIFSPPKNIQKIANNKDKILDIPISKKDNLKLQQVQKQAKNNNPEAQWKLGMIYFKGLANADENDKKAYYWINKSANKSYPPAEYMLGFLYEHGSGITKDLAKSKYYYQLAKDHGFKINTKNLA